jgi:hypothetical protein
MNLKQMTMLILNQVMTSSVTLYSHGILELNKPAEYVKHKRMVLRTLLEQHLVSANVVNYGTRFVAPSHDLRRHVNAMKKCKEKREPANGLD